MHRACVLNTGHRRRETRARLDATRAGRSDHVGASADLRAVKALVSVQVKVLDGVVRYRFGDNAELMGAWASAHNVVGPFRSRAAPGSGWSSPPGPLSVPERGDAPEVVKPAA